MSLEITEMFDGIKNGTIELQQFHDWLCEPYESLSDEEIKAIENSVKYSELALSHDEYMTKFAHLILKKASEK